MHTDCPDTPSLTALVHSAAGIMLTGSEKHGAVNSTEALTRQVSQSMRNKLPETQAPNSMKFLGAQGSEACQDILFKVKDKWLQVAPPTM